MVGIRFFSYFVFITVIAGEMIRLDKNEKKPTHPKLASFSQNAHLRPTKCQVCRVLVTELMIELNKTANVKDTLHLTNRLDGDETEDSQKAINYQRSEIRLMESLEHVCKNTRNYKAIAGPDFPYLKGVKSMFQTELENMMGKSGLKLQLDAPKDIVDDPTLEVKRLEAFCNQMIETNEEDIEDWYMNHQEKDPIDYVCKTRILKEKDTECLRASTEVPDFATKPLPEKVSREEL